MSMKVKFIEKDKVHQEETTNYWFRVNGDLWAVSDCKGEIKLLDDEGYPINPCNDRGQVLDLLMPEYEKRIND